LILTYGLILNYSLIPEFLTLISSHRSFGPVLRTQTLPKIDGEIAHAGNLRT